MKPANVSKQSESQVNNNKLNNIQPVSLLSSIKPDPYLKRTNKNLL
jgi:hypothetical protein